MYGAAIRARCVFITDGGSPADRGQLCTAHRRKSSEAGPSRGERGAARSAFPLACVSAFVGMNDLILLLQPMIF